MRKSVTRKQNTNGRRAGRRPLSARALGVFLLAGCWSIALSVAAEVIRQDAASGDPEPMTMNEPTAPEILPETDETPTSETVAGSVPKTEETPTSETLAASVPAMPPQEVSPAAPAPSAAAPDKVLLLPELVPVAEARTVREKVERTLEIEVEGKGAIAPNALLLAEPGQVFTFQAKLAQETLTTQSADLASVTADEQPRRLVLESNRYVSLETTGGVTKSFTPLSAVWQAPKEPGLQKVALEIEESFSRRSEGTKESESRQSEVAHGRQAIPVMVQYPFDRTGSGILDGYAIGIYPSEKASNIPGIVARAPNTYAPPKWFVKVTKETREMYVSPHFRLGDFASPGEKGRDHFIAIQPVLIDFLEEVWKTAQKEYGDSARVVVLRAYLSPNEALRLEQKGVRYTAFTRYLYGDAAGVVVDLDGRGVLGDLNRDGRVDRDDANQLADLLERVQDAMKVQGGLGVVDRPLEPDWPETPYAVVDLRGVRSRW